MLSRAGVCHSSCIPAVCPRLGLAKLKAAQQHHEFTFGSWICAVVWCFVQHCFTPSCSSSSVHAASWFWQNTEAYTCPGWNVSFRFFSQDYFSLVLSYIYYFTQPNVISRLTNLSAASSNPLLDGNIPSHGNQDEEPCKKDPSDLATSCG